MSNIFEEFFPEESPDYHVGQFENDNQRLLRERFDSLVDRNAIELLMFDASDGRAFRPIMFGSGDRELEESEPQFTKLLTHNMLRRSGLDAPMAGDPRFVIDRQYKDGSRSVIFDVMRPDESSVSVYFQTENDGVSPRHMYYVGSDHVRETQRLYKDLEDRGKRLSRRVKMSSYALSTFSVDELEEFSATYDEIQKL